MRIYIAVLRVPRQREVAPPRGRRPGGCIYRRGRVSRQGPLRGLWIEPECSTVRAQGSANCTGFPMYLQRMGQSPADKKHPIMTYIMTRGHLPNTL